MGHLNPLACVGFASNKVAKHPKAAARNAKTSTKPDPVPPVAADDASAGSQDADAATSSAGPKRRGEAGKSGGVNARSRPRPRGHHGEATAWRGGFMPYRPLYSYDIDPVANSMYFYGSVGGIMC
ncbi:hypothetical protein ZWY2020_055723 [Hordeum vulgare]|nr:hypothetical protein ZWY2020_055723 [Hordeum vulgare]